MKVSLRKLKEFMPSQLQVPSKEHLGISNSWGEGTYLALVGLPSSDGIMIKIPYEVDVLLRRPASHPIFSYWVG